MTEVPYESTDANVTLGPFAGAVLPGRMIAWLELFRRTEDGNDYRSLHLRVGFAGLPVTERSRGPVLIGPS
jgi:hypothetical protein